jgi:hypothetical protein
MLITRTSEMTGVEHTLDINVTASQLKQWLDGELIQDVMPHLSREDREFLMTGITPEEWDKLSDEPSSVSWELYNA